MAGGASVDLGFVEPMLRRRLSPLARVTLCAAHDCVQDVEQFRFVYASRHGEIARTTSMLESLADKESLSPTVFGLSVLNAVTGLFSILLKNTEPATAISAGCASFGYGLMEASLQLASYPEQPVLYVYSDELVPAVYGDCNPPESRIHAVALLLDTSATTRISCDTTDSPVPESSEIQSYAFLRALQQGASEWCGAGRQWSWSRSGDSKDGTC
ncbi:beta-ketoacyl synthase chain length factor [Propionivibrio soli]|uniref:beta-ketoacyl synthase chain length factor n=1 Tax=Propionivibrio soli TaxID=2976531 RepID=UPI0021E70A48